MDGRGTSGTEKLVDKGDTGKFPQGETSEVRSQYTQRGPTGRTVPRGAARGEQTTGRDCEKIRTKTEIVEKPVVYMFCYSGLMFWFEFTTLLRRPLVDILFIEP